MNHPTLWDVPLPAQPTATQVDRTAVWSEKAAKAHPVEVARLAEIALDLALRYPTGITIDNVLQAVHAWGLMPLIGKGRSHSFLGAVCRKAGLIPTGKRIRSQIAGKNGNWRNTWVHPDARGR